MRMNGELRELVNEVYGKLLQTTNGILHKCKTFELSVLLLEDPSYEEIAVQLGDAADILWTISDHFPSDPEGLLTATKASEHAQAVRNIARAIRTEDKKELENLVAELDRRSML